MGPSQKARRRNSPPKLASRSASTIYAKNPADAQFGSPVAVEQKFGGLALDRMKVGLVAAAPIRSRATK